MNRRTMLVAGAAALLPFAARAQKAMPVIGFLSYAAPNTVPRAFLSGLAQAGYEVGQNVKIEYRWADGDYRRLEQYRKIANGLLHAADH